MAQTTPKPKVLLVSLDFQPFFDENYAQLINDLSTKADIQRVKGSGSALNRISGENPPAAILITDAALSNQKSKAPVWDAILNYVRQGGTAVVMGHFSSFAKPLKIGPFFQKAGLPWESGDYHRTDTALNPSVVPGGMAKRLPREYSQKALAVKNVAPGDVWYTARPDSVVQSAVFSPDNAYRPGQAAVAMAKVGEGKLGYLGDVNAESESQTVVLAMCGLL